MAVWNYETTLDGLTMKKEGRGSSLPIGDWNCNPSGKVHTRFSRVASAHRRVMSSHCIECHACCQGLVVYLEDEDYVRVPQRFVDFIHGRPHLRQQPNHVHTCAALDAQGRCTIYEIRPNRCRRFQEDCPRCQSWRHGKDRSA
jgi:hypothetical protein